MRCPCLCVYAGFWDRDYVSQLPYVWYYVGVKSGVGPQPSFPTIQTIERVCFSVVLCRHLWKLQQLMWCF